MARARYAAAMVLVLAAAAGCGPGGKEDVAPVADIVCGTVHLVGSQVILDASQSTDDSRDTLSYQWELSSVPSGSTLTSDDILNRDKAVAAVTFDVEGDFSVSLTVTDQGGQSDSDSVVIEVSRNCFGAPDTPTGLAVGDPTSSSLLVSWNATPCATSYQVYRDLDAGGAFTEGVYDSEGTSFTDDGVAPGATYWYKVRASGQFSSALSEAVSGTSTGTPDTTPPAVSTFVINDGAATTETAAVVLTIDASDAESGMKDMQFSNDGGVSWSEWIPFAATTDWTLSTGDELKTVRAAFRNKALIVQQSSDTISLDEWRNVRVTFVSISVVTCGDIPGPGEWYWSFTAFAGDEAYTVDQRSSGNCWSCTNLEVLSLGAYRDLMVANSAGSSVGVLLWAGEFDDPSTIAIGEHSATYPYPDFGAGTHEALLGVAKGPMGTFAWQIQLID